LQSKAFRTGFCVVLLDRAVGFLRASKHTELAAHLFKSAFKEREGDPTCIAACQSAVFSRTGSH